MRRFDQQSAGQPPRVQIAAEEFLGRWRLERETRDHRAGQVARFDGHAEITPDPSEAGAGTLWHYKECGVLRLENGATMQAERRYLWHPRASGVSICFEDGRFFHDLELAEHSPRCTAAHWCDPDHYKVHYDFTEWPAWRAEWHVNGPRKDYVMVSLFVREGGF